MRILTATILSLILKMSRIIPTHHYPRWVYKAHSSLKLCGRLIFVHLILQGISIRDRILWLYSISLRTLNIVMILWLNIDRVDIHQPVCISLLSFLQLIPFIDLTYPLHIQRRWLKVHEFLSWLLSPRRSTIVDLVSSLRSWLMWSQLIILRLIPFLFLLQFFLWPSSCKRILQSGLILLFVPDRCWGWIHHELFICF